MGLTNSQQAALTQIEAFLADKRITSFSLQGGAGVGKTFLVGQVVKHLLAQGHRTLVAAPTHKACRVLRSKLDVAGIRWAFKPAFEVPSGIAIVDTTAALLGVRPVIDDDQDETEVKFKTTGQGSLGKLFGTNGAELGRCPVLVIDEVSMLGREDLLALVGELRARGAKLIAVGDDGQLPPVKKQAIDFNRDFEQSALLDEVVRQAKGSAIVQLAWAIRRDEPWEDVVAQADLLGPDIEKVDGNLAGRFLATLEAPVDDEGQRSVYIAYRNAVVNAVQEEACKKLYGHGRLSFKVGQLVLSTTAGYAETYGTYIDRNGFTRPSKFPKLEQLVAVADQLRVLAFDESRADAIYGVPVKLERVDLPKGAQNRIFETHYLSEEQILDKTHPFNLRKEELALAARALQDEVKKLRSEGKGDAAVAVDTRRKAAWQTFFAHQQKIISFSHPFAITSHKSQGSTYKEVFVNVGDLVRFNKKALYVAVTRPSKKLVL